MKKNYKIFKLENSSFPYMVLRTFAHDSRKQWRLIEEEMADLNIEGWILLDDLFKGGNISTRFSKIYYEKGFAPNTYFSELEDDSMYRKLTSAYVKENNLARGSNLTEEEIEAIEAGEII